MASLFVGEPAYDVVASEPLLGKAMLGNNFDCEDPQSPDRTPTTSSPCSSETDLEFELSSKGGSSVKVDYDDGKTCCPQFLKSAVAVLIAVCGITFSVLAFVYTPVNPLSSSIWVYIMGAICILNALVMIRNEKFFLFSMPASRNEIIELLAAKKHLEAEINSLTEEVELLERSAARCIEAEIKLQRITDAQSANYEDFLQLVHENEETLDLIREHLRHKVIEDVVGVIITNHDGTQLIDNVQAKSLATKIKAKMEDSGVFFDEDKFLHALAMNSTLLGAISTVRRLLPRDGSPEQFDKDDTYDMFYLPNDDPRQRGSVHAARAIAGTHVSLAPSPRRRPKQHTGDDWNEDSSSDSGIPKKHKNRVHELLCQFRMMAFPYFRESREGRFIFAILILLTLVSSGINVYFSYLIRDFSTALAEKHVQEFYQVMFKFMISMVVLIPLQVSYRFIRVKLGIAWRKWLTERVLKLYFSNRVYYGLERQSKAAVGSARDYNDRKKEMDNPDQRIQEDVASFTGYSLNFFLTVLHTIMDLVSFSLILFSIMPQLFIAIIIFASVGTIFTVLIGKILIKLNYESLQREADFRFSLVRIRENAESIAFYAGEAVEKGDTNRKFNRVVDNMTSMNWATLRLDTFTATYNHLVNLLPVFILAHQYFTDMIEFGVIAQTRGAFGHILNDLSIIIHEFSGIASFMAGIDRLFLFMKAIQELDNDRPNEDATVMVAKESIAPDQVTITPSDGITVEELDDASVSSSFSASPQPILTMRNLRLATPDNKRVLIENLNLSVSMGQNLLIAGVSGAGKSSLLRAIAGLWHSGGGEITRSKNVYFLPQKPYCPPGTLRDQLLYPASTELGYEDQEDYTQRGANWSDEDLLNILASVELPDLARRSGDGDPIRGINAVLDWSNTLSLGEQQRLAFGRLLVNRPRLVVMDESTSALDVVAERKMYTLLKERLFSDTGDPATYVSVGHRPTLLAYHDLKLLLRDGSGHASFIPQEETTTGDQEAILRSLQR